MKIDPGMIIIRKWKDKARVEPTFLLNPHFESVHKCHGCNSLFNDVDFEQTFLDDGRCPLCKTPLDEAEGEFADTMDNFSDLLKQLRDFSENVPIDF